MSKPTQMVKIVSAVKAFGREFIARFCAPADIVLDPHHQGIGRHFAAVGKLVSSAAATFAAQHPEIPADAN